MRHRDPHDDPPAKRRPAPYLVNGTQARDGNREFQAKLAVLQIPDNPLMRLRLERTSFAAMVLIQQADI
jgi:hypothetical protein